MEPLITRYLTQWLDKDAPGWRSHVESGRYTPEPKEVDKALRGRTPQIITMLEYIKAHDNLFDPLAGSLISIIQYENSYFQKLVGSLYPLLEKVTTGEVADLLSPDYADVDDERPAFDWATVLADGGYVYVGGDALEDQSVSTAIFAAMLSDLTSLAAKLYKHGLGAGQVQLAAPRRTSIHCDEVNEMIGDEFVPMVNKIAGANVVVNAYTQTRADIEARTGNKSKALQIEGNFNNRFFFRVLNDHTAEMLTLNLPEVNYRYLTPQSGASDTNDPADFAEFGANNQDRITQEKVPMVTGADLVELPKGQAFVHTAGKLYKIRVPIIDEASLADLPRDFAEMTSIMYAPYKRHRGQTALPTLTQKGKGIGF
jgi:conjugal transfer pilus assembly protein TraD